MPHGAHAGSPFRSRCGKRAIDRVALGMIVKSKEAKSNIHYYHIRKLVPQNRYVIEKWWEGMCVDRIGTISTTVKTNDECGSSWQHDDSSQVAFTVSRTDIFSTLRYYRPSATVDAWNAAGVEQWDTSNGHPQVFTTLPSCDHILHDSNGLRQYPM